MRRHKGTIYLSMAVLAIAGLVFTLPVANAGDTAKGDSQEISRLFSEARQEASELQRDADQMEVFTRSDMGWESHYAVLAAVKDHVNKAKKIMTSLQRARDAAAPWQKQAIDEIAPLLKELASNTQLALDHFSVNKGGVLNTPRYRAYAVANYDLATELNTLIKDYIDYGQGKADFERLHNKLQVEERD